MDLELMRETLMNAPRYDIRVEEGSGGSYDITLGTFSNGHFFTHEKAMAKFIEVFTPAAIAELVGMVDNLESLRVVQSQAYADAAARHAMVLTENGALRREASKLQEDVKREQKHAQFWMNKSLEERESMSPHNCYVRKLEEAVKRHEGLLREKGIEFQAFEATDEEICGF